MTIKNNIDINYYNYNYVHLLFIIKSIYQNTNCKINYYNSNIKLHIIMKHTQTNKPFIELKFNMQDNVRTLQ